MSNQSGYIVRGAKMFCNCGSHIRKINLPTSHGAYIKSKPIMNQDDYIVDENITYFGICQSPSNQEGETIYLIHEDTGDTISGIKCCVKILEKWDNVKENTMIKGVPALTTESKLICAYDGIIAFADDGQAEE